MSFPRYPSYKDSGVEWLGKVPAHWGIDRIKRSTSIAKNGIWGDEPQQDEFDIPCVRVADFDRQVLRVELIEPTIRNVVEKERVGRVLSRGDLLLEKSGGGEGQPVGCVVLYDDPRPAVCSNFVARVQTAPGMNSSFWRYVHAAAYAVRLNTRSIKQTSGIQNLDASQYLDERAGFPPLSEQTQIATFLDRETAKIDELVAEQRRLMELLKEKRQAVISHAVTKGMNPDVPMKPSGIEWLGDVPAHWSICALGYLSTIQTGSTPDRAKLEYWEGDIPWLKTGEINYELIMDSEERITEAGLQNSAAKVADVGALMMAMYGQGITRGRVAILGIRAAYNQACAAITPGKKLYNEYAKYFFMMAYKFVRDSGNETSQMNLGSRIIAKIRVLAPPMEEQRQIASFLKMELAKLDTLTTEAQRVIDLLQERRTALISAAVTGQIDVRAAL